MLDAEKLTTSLYEKMKTEQDSYQAWLVSQPPEEILNHTYEYTIRQDILMALEERDLTAPQAEALLASPSPLADLYGEWSKQETGYMDDIRDTIEAHADELIRREDEMRKAPIYTNTIQYAQDSGEVEQYWASYKANIACAEAIHSAITNHHDAFSFDSKAAVKDVVEKFGYDRTLFVLAVTIQNKERDGRFSHSSKRWANTVPAFDVKSIDYSVKSHSSLIEMFVTTARHEYLLSQPLTKDDIKGEALKIMSKFQNAHGPNGPNGTHYMAQISPDFLARANTNDMDYLTSILSFQSLSFSTLEDRKGTFALISKDEDRFQKMILLRPSVRRKLQEQPDAPKPPTKSKNKARER